MKLKDEQDWYEAVAEYARNVVAIWDQPRADTVTGQATHANSLVRGMDLLRDALDSYPGAPDGGNDGG